MAARRNRRTKRYGFAFEATTMTGVTMFKGAANSGRQSVYMVTQEAIVEAIFKAKDHGFSRMLVLCNHKKLVQICNLSSKPSWQDQALLFDLWQLKQQSFEYIWHFVPRLVMTNVFHTASVGANCPGHFITRTSLQRLKLCILLSFIMLFN